MRSPFNDQRAAIDISGARDFPIASDTVNVRKTPSDQGKYELCRADNSCLVPREVGFYSDMAVLSCTQVPCNSCRPLITQAFNDMRTLGGSQQGSLCQLLGVEPGRDLWDAL